MKNFIWLGRAEAMSFLILLLIAMPLKYVWGAPEAVRWVGSIHGALFVAYVGWAALLAWQLKWGIGKWVLSAVLASVPLGTFFFEKEYLEAK